MTRPTLLADTATLSCAQKIHRVCTRPATCPCTCHDLSSSAAELIKQYKMERASLPDHKIVPYSPENRT